MIRRDYFMRMVQELTQALSRILFLKKAQEYPLALQEIERILNRFWKLTPEQIKEFSLEQWIEQCRQEEGPMGEKLIALADLFKEQSELYAVAENKRDKIAAHEGLRAPAPLRSGAIALGLYLEAVTTPQTIVTVDLMARIETLIEQTRDSRLPAEVLKRLLSYYETRGMLDKAEDVLFDWLDTPDPEAPEGGLAFYERADAKSDQELEQGHLPRDEIAQGRGELRKRPRS